MFYVVILQCLMHEDGEQACKERRLWQQLNSIFLSQSHFMLDKQKQMPTFSLKYASNK